MGSRHPGLADFIWHAIKREQRRPAADHEAVVILDNVATIPVADLGRQIGRLLPEQEAALTEAIHAAFDLD